MLHLILLTDAKTITLVILTAKEVHSVQQHISEKQVGEKVERILQNQGRKKQRCTDINGHQNHCTKHSQRQYQTSGHWLNSLLH